MAPMPISETSTVSTVEHHYTASARQTLFHTSKAYETLYGGAAGGGKTAALCAEAIALGFQYPGITIYYFRRTFPELESTAVVEIQKQAAELIEAGLLKYNNQKHVFEFQNGSRIQLAYCEHPGDVYRYQSAEYQVLMVDELTHFPLETYEYLRTRVRTSDPNFPLKIMCATNPGNIGHGWVKRRFIEDFEPETLYKDPENGLTRQFIPAKVADNPIARIRDDYTQSLAAISNESTRRALLEGDWDQFAGQAFTEWRREVHVVNPIEVEIEPHWPRWMSYDWGYGSWAAGLWFAKDPFTKIIYVYRELYVSKMALSEQATLILDLDRQENIRYRLADPSLWKQAASAETGETIAQVFAKNKIYFDPANNNRPSGKMAVHSALSIQENGLPGLRVFQNCVNLIRTLPELPYDEHNPEDIDTDAEDHLYDALRYGLMNQRVISTHKNRPKQRYTKTGRRIS